MNLIESLLHQLSGWFLAPVLLLILALFLYACYALGRFAVEAVQRRAERRLEPSPERAEHADVDQATKAEPHRAASLRRQSARPAAASRGPRTGAPA